MTHIRKTLTLVASLALLAFPAVAKDAKQLVDPARSTVQWTGSKVVGGSHTGKVKVKSGSLQLTDGVVKSGEIVVDMTSIVDEDLKEKEWNDKLVGHLKSEDFFDVAKHPEAKLVVTKIEALKGGEYSGKGTLTIKGKDQPVDFKATEKSVEGGRILKTSVTFDRTGYDVKYGSGKFFTNLGDKMIADEVKLDVEIFFKGTELSSR